MNLTANVYVCEFWFLGYHIISFVNWFVLSDSSVNSFGINTALYFPASMWWISRNWAKKIHIYLTNKCKKGRAAGTGLSDHQSADRLQTRCRLQCKLTSSFVFRQDLLNAISCLYTVCCVQVRSFWALLASPSLAPPAPCVHIAWGAVGFPSAGTSSGAQHTGEDESGWLIRDQGKPRENWDWAWSFISERSPVLPAPSPHCMCPHFSMFILCIPFSCLISYQPHQLCIETPSCHCQCGRRGQTWLFFISFFQATYTLCYPAQWQGHSVKHLPFSPCPHFPQGGGLQAEAQPNGCAATAACSVHKCLLKAWSSY